MIAAYSASVSGGRSLTELEATRLMGAVMDGEGSEEEIKALLLALRAKGETVDEITGFARVLRARSLAVEVTADPLLDVCGTGGDGGHTFNVSTAVSFVVASYPLAIAKHGNRAASSKVGSADVLEALGARIDLTPGQVADCIAATGIGFLFAQTHHPAMKRVGKLRRELGVRTVFNLLGPLVNPASPTHQVIGVSEAAVGPKLAEALGRLGGQRAAVVHGIDGLDEVSTVGSTQISWLRDCRVTEEVLTPEDLGFACAEIGSLRGGETAAENAEIVRAILRGEQGPRQDIVAANAAAAFLVAGVCATWDEACKVAVERLESGAALSRLEEFVEYTRKAAA